MALVNASCYCTKSFIIVLHIWRCLRVFFLIWKVLKLFYYYTMSYLGNTSFCIVMCTFVLVWAINALDMFDVCSLCHTVFMSTLECVFKYICDMLHDIFISVSIVSMVSHVTCVYFHQPVLLCYSVCLFVLTWNLYLLKVSGLTFSLLTCYWQCFQVNIHLLLMPMNRSSCICVTFYHLLYTLNVLFCYGHLLGCLAFNYFLYTLHTVIHR